MKLLSACRGFRSASRRPLATLLALATLLGGALLPVVTAPSAEAYPGTHVHLEGRGWGHGRGMGQWGSLGYAVDHGWSYSKILDHFYGNTSMGSVNNRRLSVSLLAHQGEPTIVAASGGLKTSVTGTATYSAVKVVQVGTSNKWDVFVGSGCGSSFSNQVKNDVAGGSVSYTSGSVEITPVNNSDPDKGLRVCESGGEERWYRGEIWASRHPEVKSQRTVNYVWLDDYLKGVVPRESPASWGDRSGGMEALKAQAVAARSYAIADRRDWDYAETCDTTACQVYGGYRHSRLGVLEVGNTNKAVNQTSGKVRVRSGGVQRTEFSSSTGGYSAGGTFPAVRDAGDDVSGNPNHAWTAQVAVKSIESRYPAIGRLVDVDITERNGKGDWGGRVRKVALVGTSRTVTISGNEFRSRFGLKSDWFTVTNRKPAGYWLMSSKGGFYTLSRGNIPFHGSAAGIRTVGEFVAGMAHPERGYYAVTDRGAVYAFDAPFHGAATDIRTVGRFVDAFMHPSGKGYYLITDRGAVYTFGDVPFYGAATNIRTVGRFVAGGMHHTGKGYYLITDRGAVYTFGDVPFHGAATNIPTSPIVEVLVHPQGRGYGLISDRGGVYAFGGFPFRGSVASIPISGKVVGASFHPDGGYYMVTDGGGVYALNSPFFGSATSIPHPGIVDILWYPKSQ